MRRREFAAHSIALLPIVREASKITAMTTDPRISEILLRPRISAHARQAVTVDDLCGECPELADEIRKRVGEPQPHPTIAEASAEQITSSSSAGLPQTVAAPRYPQVPGYEFLSEVGRGGMGVVYKARQSSLNRAVAIKTILSGAHAGTRERARFYAEAEAVAKLQHPNIVQIYDIGDRDGRALLLNGVHRRP